MYGAGFGVLWAVTVGCVYCMSACVVSTGLTTQLGCTRAGADAAPPNDAPTTIRCLRTSHARPASIAPSAPPAAAASSKARPDLSWTPAAMMQSAVSGSREVMTAHALAAREPAGARSANKVPAIRHPPWPRSGINKNLPCHHIAQASVLASQIPPAAVALPCAHHPNNNPN